MSTRVTPGMMNTQLIGNLQRNISQMNTYQNQLSTGRKINKPSDDPVGITFSMRYRSELAANDQYQRNVDRATSSLDYADTMLGQANDVFQRLRELTVQAANGTNSDTSLNTIQSEVGELYNQLVNIGNSQFNGKYVFNGQLTDQPPYSTVPLTDTDPTKIKAISNDTDPGAINYQLGAGVQVAVNVTGNDAFGTSSDPTTNTFQIVSDLYTALGKQDSTAIGDILGRLDTRMDNLLKTRADIGARSNRVELIQNRLGDAGVNLQSLQSKTEDADVPEVITNMKMSENVYQASLSVGAKLISPSLVDFLK